MGVTAALVLIIAFLLRSLLLAIRQGYCHNLTCSSTAEFIASSSRDPDHLVHNCTVTSLLLVRSGGNIRDRILLLGSKNSVSEYVLPTMHLAKYDSTLSDPSFSRQGLSAVKYGFPFSIPSASVRLLLFKLGLADAIVLSPQKILGRIEPETIKFQFRMQPYKTRKKLPPIPITSGISEDSEVVESYLDGNPTLFGQGLYSCL